MGRRREGKKGGRKEGWEGRRWDGRRLPTGAPCFDFERGSGQFLPVLISPAARANLQPRIPFGFLITGVHGPFCETDTLRYTINDYGFPSNEFVGPGAAAKPCLLFGPWPRASAHPLDARVGFGSAIRSVFFG